MPIVQLIRDRLDELDISQADFAQQLDVTPQTVSKWVNGDSKPEPERWPQIEAALGVPLGTIARRMGLIPEDQASVHALQEEVAQFNRAQAELLKQGKELGKRLDEATKRRRL